MLRPRWILELHPDFPGPALLTPLLDHPVLLDREKDPGLRTPWPEVSAPAIAYGTMRTLTRMLRHPPLAHAVFDHYPSLSCSSYYRYVYDLLGRQAFLLPLSALPFASLARVFGDRVFVRPDRNYKLFAARVLSMEEIQHFVTVEQVHRDELVVVSEVLSLGQEYRCFVRNGRVFAHSSYPEEPYHPAPEAVLRFAEEVARRLQEALPPALWSIDVAVGGDRLRLVEVGGVNSWGIYGCAREPFIEALEAEAMDRFHAL